MSRRIKPAPDQRELINQGPSGAEIGERAALEAGKVSVHTSAEIVHSPSPEDAERAIELRGVGGDEADLIGGLNDRPKWSTPGVPPAKLQRGIDIRDRQVGRHGLRNPTRRWGAKAGLDDVAEIAQKEAVRRSKEVVVDDGPTLHITTEVIAAEQLESIPRQQHPNRSPKAFWLDLELVAFYDY